MQDLFTKYNEHMACAIFCENNELQDKLIVASFNIVFDN